MDDNAGIFIFKWRHLGGGEPWMNEPTPLLSSIIVCFEGTDARVLWAG